MKPNILLFINSFIQGGTERQTVQLTRLLHERGRYHVNLACIARSGVLLEEVERLGFKDIPEFPLTSFYDLNAVKQLRRFTNLLNAQRIDLVQTSDFYTNIFGITGAALARVPVRIASLRETDGARSAAQKLVVRRVYDFAHGIIANAEAVREQLIRDGVHADKVTTIYNGVDIERISPRLRLTPEDIRTKFNLPGSNQHHIVTIVANLRAMKDHLTFLRAAQRVRAVFPETTFVLAGDGELANEVSALISRLGMESYALMIGRCADVAGLLSISSVCVLSSNCGEGFSNSIIEYMAAARPVVATDVGGTREAVVDGETGYIVRIGNDEEMADRIISLLKDPERARRMGERGLQVVKQKFSCEAQLERVENLFDRLMQRRLPPLITKHRGVRQEAQNEVTEFSEGR